MSRISTGILADIRYRFLHWQNSDWRKLNIGQDYQTTSSLISPIGISWKIGADGFGLTWKFLGWLLRRNTFYELAGEFRIDYLDRTLHLILWKLIIAHYGFIFFLIITFTHCNSGQVLQIIEDTGKLGTIWIVQIVSKISLPSLKS